MSPDQLPLVYVIFGVLLILYLIFRWTFGPLKYKLPRFSLLKYHTAQKEKSLLADLIKDMKANPGHWVMNSYCPVTFHAPMLVNDYSSIGIQYGQRTETPTLVLIHFNLANKTKFDQNDDNSIVTRIEGNHAQKFINTVTKIMDERGKELDYFRSRIKERL